ncbi:MAG: hypothetical protein ACREQ5_12955 [Candidatus Dormibacteria bacterium]
MSEPTPVKSFTESIAVDSVVQWKGIDVTIQTLDSDGTFTARSPNGVWYVHGHISELSLQLETKE